MKKKDRASTLSSLAMMAPLIGAVAFLHLEHGVPFDVFIFGSGSWGVGCIVKLALYHGIVRRIRHDAGSIDGVATLNGLVSGVAELGAALPFLALLPSHSFWDIVGFGIGIGAIEAALLATTTDPLKGTALESAAREMDAALTSLTGRRRLVVLHVLPLVERLIAAAIHVGTRGLVYVAYRAFNVLPLLIALAAFLLADGIIGYKLAYQGRFKELRVLGLAYVALAVIALLTCMAFLAYWRALSPPAGQAGV